MVPATDSYSINIIKSYFSLYLKDLESILRTKRLSTRFRKSSTNKIYVSNGEFKHTNNKVEINVYLFNRQMNNYNSAIEKIKNNLLVSLKQKQKLFSQRLISLKKKSLLTLNDDKLFLISKLKEEGDKKLINNYVNIYIENICKKIINNEQSVRLLYWYYRQIKFLNKSKYTYVYLQHLKEQIYKIYNKQVEFNLINIKRFYLNSDIVTESITKKIAKNRKRTLFLLTSIKNKVRVIKRTSFLHKYVINNRLDKKQNILKSTNYLVKTVAKNLKYKDVTGFRLEAKGRLTKRFKAARSLYKVKYKGNLLNRDSSLKGLPSVLLKGNLKSNVQYSKSVSKSRIGSFGIKGWISGD